MIQLNSLKPAPGSKHRKKIIGRGEGSGHGGKGSTRGFKGQTARSGDKSMPLGFEGGQVPLYRRIPKRGFNNKVFRKSYSLVNVEHLNEKFSPGDQISPEILRAAGLNKRDKPVKILGEGEILKALKVKAHSFSETAKSKIEKAGGAIEIITGR